MKKLPIPKFLIKKLGKQIQGEYNGFRKFEVDFNHV